jgi:hypothetical protein
VKVALLSPAPVVTAAPVPAGWTATIERNVVTWSGGRLAGKQEGSFTVTVGPMPSGERAAFKVVQTYDDGQVERWIDEPLPGGAEPEHPAPVVRLTPGPSTSTTSTTSTTRRPTTTTAPDDGSGGGTPVALVVLVVLALGAVGAVLVTRRRPSSRHRTR